ncbi:MAG TPA: hypothetical protein VK814_02420 [Acidobacteriaceae bacterium]|nr:hypothetical protein [Acidobacteriaceae bacterium]
MNSHPDELTMIATQSSAANHLTPDQIDDHLIGDLAPTPAAHLAACTLCAERVAAARAPLASFQHVSTAWSERRSATLPIPVPARQAPVWQRHMAWATATLSMALGFAFINATHQFSILDAPQPAPIASTSARLTPVQQPAITARAHQAATLAPAPRAIQVAAQVSADNHMLRAIDASLDPSTDSPAALGLQPATAPNPGPPASLQD